MPLSRMVVWNKDSDMDRTQHGQDTDTQKHRKRDTQAHTYAHTGTHMHTD